jgi:hypothetical protein
MEARKGRRIMGKLTPAQEAKLKRQRKLIAAELPDLIARDDDRREAAAEPTLSGELRRAIHGSRQPLATLAEQAGLAPSALDEFLTGERTLRSDVLDRLAHLLHLTLTPAD